MVWHWAHLATHATHDRKRSIRVDHARTPPTDKRARSTPAKPRLLLKILAPLAASPLGMASLESLASALGGYAAAPTTGQRTRQAREQGTKTRSPTPGRTVPTRPQQRTHRHQRTRFRLRVHGDSVGEHTYHGELFEFGRSKSEPFRASSGALKYPGSNNPAPLVASQRPALGSAGHQRQAHAGC